MLGRVAVAGIVLTTILLFGVFSFVASAVSQGDNYPGMNLMGMGAIGGVAKIDLAFQWTLRTVGGVLSVLTAVSLFRIVRHPQHYERILPCCVALLGSLTLTSAHWTTITSFGAVTLAYMTFQWLDRRQPKPALPSAASVDESSKVPAEPS